MKLTDLAIIFTVFFCAIILTINMKTDNHHNNVINNIMYNNVMDIIVEDSLMAGFNTVDNKGRPKINLDELASCFKSEIQLYNGGDNHILIYTDNEGFYCCDTFSGFEFGEKVWFTDERHTAHEQKVYQIGRYIEEKYGVSLALPLNDGENLINTIEDYSLIGISVGVSRKVNCFSGAKVRFEKEKSIS